ncbi:MAG: polymer-forming cytoskeletal protein [Nitrospirae bacterium YQR-1]
MKGATQIDGFIATGVILSGRLVFDGTLRIDGKFQGEIDSSGTLIVGESAFIDSMNINVDTALISGEVRGVVEAKTKVELLSQCRVYGDIKTPLLVVYSGAFFEGCCEMSKFRQSPSNQVAIEIEG